MQMSVRLFSRHDDVPEKWQVLEQGLEHRQQIFGDDQRAHAAVFQHELVVRCGQQRIGAHRHDAGLDRAEEHAWKIDRVEMGQHDPVFHFQPQPGQCLSRAVDASGELGVGVTALIVDINGLAAAPGNKITLDEIVGRVVLARNIDQGRAHAVIRLA